MPIAYINTTYVFFSCDCGRFGADVLDGGLSLDAWEQASLPMLMLMHLCIGQQAVH